MKTEERTVIEIKNMRITPDGLILHEWYLFPKKQLLFHKMGDNISRWEGPAAKDKFNQEFGYGKTSK